MNKPLLNRVRPSAQPAVPGFALWNLGFRPFYLLASAFSAFSVLLWAVQYWGLLLRVAELRLYDLGKECLGCVHLHAEDFNLFGEGGSHAFHTNKYFFGAPFDRAGTGLDFFEKSGLTLDFSNRLFDAVEIRSR